MSSAKGKLVLILGLQRTGTTLLASMLGGHSEVNMLFESVGSDTTSLIGKKISANKLLVYRQIRFTQRASRLGHLINRIVNLDFKIKNKHHRKRPYPTSKLSIKDYEKLGCKFIIIERDEKSSIDSMMSRAKQSFAEAKNEYDKGMLTLTKVKALDSHTISFLDLVNNTEITLKNICEFLEIDFEKRMLEGPKYNFVYPNEKVIRKTS
tara:strand:- start:1684 stop:2307 length:624 start_codon:yes stop_codon:yes gene_type:complete